jgi:hypothetical protein
MRTLTIILVTTFVFLLAQQLTAAPPGLDQEESGASQAVVIGFIKCSPANRQVGLAIRGFGELGVASQFDLFSEPNLAQDCSDLIPALVEQVPDRMCEISNTFIHPNDDQVQFFFTCTGDADAAISTVGKMMKAVTRLGQT